MTSSSKAQRRACGDGNSPVAAPSAFSASSGRRRRSTQTTRSRSTSERSWSPAANPGYRRQTRGIYGLAYRASGFGGAQPPKPTCSDNFDLKRCSLRCLWKVWPDDAGGFAQGFWRLWPQPTGATALCVRLLRPPIPEDPLRPTASRPSSPRPRDGTRQGRTVGDLEASAVDARVLSRCDPRSRRLSPGTRLTTS